MKKIGTLLVFIFMLVLTSCSTKFDLEKCKQDILAQEGWEVFSEYTTEEELNRFEDSIINQMKVYDNYIVEDLEISYAVSYSKGEISYSDLKLVSIYVFTNSEDADEFEYWDIEYRGEDSIWRTARHGNIVIHTSDETMYDVIGLKFK